MKGRRPFCYTGCDMFYLFYGTESEKARARMHEILEGAKKKRPDAEIFRVEGAGFHEGMIDEWTGGMGLFERKMIVVLDKVFENKDAAEALAARAEALAASENMILILEGKIDKKTLGRLEKHAFKAEVYDEKKEAPRFGAAPAGGGGNAFNIFFLTDALGARDKKSLWSLYCKSQLSGVVPEEVSGILFWQLKAMRLASPPLADAKSTGLNPFVFNKAKTYARNFSSKELDLLSSRLVASYHDAHRGLNDFSVELEKFVLSL